MVIASTLAAFSVQATDGYFSDGFGIKSKGRAGVALTETDDAFGGANNPATIALEEDRFDIGVDWFRPSRSASRTGPATPLNGSVTSSRADFFVPETGYKQALSDHWAFGVSIYGNGGMNTDYPAGQLYLGPGATGQNLLAGSGRLGVNFSQLFVAPTLSYKISEHHSIGIAPILGYQRFNAYGLNAFSPLSQNPAALTDRGADNAWGGGARIGYLWSVTKEVSLGAAYTTPIYTTGFNKYRGLFAGDGSFDAPQTVGGGVGWQVLPQLRLGTDYKWIDYSGINPVGNPSTNPGALGQLSGPGFGWRSISVIKFGADWQTTDSLTLRTGYAFAQNPVQSRDVTFNIVAPGVVQHHLTFGATYALGRHEITVAYLHAFENSVSGESRFTALGLAPVGTTESVSMSQNSFAIEYSFKF